MTTWVRTRYPEIAKLNAKVLGGRPGFITPGTILQLPTSTPIDGIAAGQTVIVKRGDTLSGIAEDQLGDADRYPEIFKASQGDHPTGNRTHRPRRHRRRLDPQNPRGGATKGHRARNGHRTAKRISARRGQAKPEPTAKPGHRPRPGATPTLGRPNQRRRGRLAVLSRGGRRPSRPDARCAGCLTGLTGGGVVLAASLLLLLRTRRRSQSGTVRPGRTIAVPGQQLTPVEKTITAVGDLSAPASPSWTRPSAASRPAKPPPTGNAAGHRGPAVQQHDPAAPQPSRSTCPPWQNADERC